MMRRVHAAAAVAALTLGACNRPAQTAASVAPAAPARDGGIGAAVPNVGSSAGSGAASAGGPFGLAMGEPLSALKVVKQLDGESRYDITPPATNAEFEEYVVKAPPRTGLCRVSGIGATHHGDADGAKLRAIMAGFVQALDAKYGVHDTHDSLDSGSSLTGADQFASGLDKGERTLTHTWSRGSGSHLPSGLQEITAYGKAVDADGTYLQLTYLFDNYDRCEGHGDAPAGAVGSAL